ncbi:hypothetical protein JCM11641_006767 [Rhodosporidiobolus odoratus]
MPVPSLPLDIVALMFSHLSGQVHITERHALGLRLALVCNKWASLGLDLAWDEVRIKSQDVVNSRFLCQHPEATTRIRELHVYETGPETGPTAQVQHLLLACRRLSTLYLRPPCGSNDLFEAASLSPSTPRLSLLHVQADFDLPGDCIAFMQLLPAFTNLNNLTLLLHDHGPQSSTSLTLPNQIAPVNLGLGLAGRGEDMQDAVISLINPKRLNEVTIAATQSTLPTKLVEWLPSGPVLETVVFVATPCDLVSDLLLALVNTLPHLNSLSTLRIILAGSDDAEASPLTMSQLTACLPPSLKHAELEGVYFHADDQIQFFGDGDNGRIVKTVVHMLLEDEDRFGHDGLQSDVLACAADQDGNRLWGLLGIDPAESSAGDEKTTSEDELDHE